MPGLAVVAVAALTAIAAPAVTDAVAASASPRSRCVAIDEAALTNAAPDTTEATPVNGETPATPSIGGVSQGVSVQVPPGRLYLEPASLSIVVPATSHGVLPEVLAADLREDAPGWQLTLTVTRLTRGGEDVVEPQRVTITPGEPRNVAGNPDVQAGRPAQVGVGGCVVMATGTGWGSSFVGATIGLGPGPAPDSDTEVGVVFHLRPLDNPA